MNLMAGLTTEEAEYIIEKQKSVEIDYKAKIENLPYVFKDPIRINKIIDPKKLLFGSKICLA